MSIAFDKLPGLDRERVLAAVEPVLRAHGVDGVELVWRTDRGGWVLELTVERPGTQAPGAGVTIDLCTDISRDLSAALDVADVIHAKYRLEVGSPGLDRALHGANDYVRFAGRLAKVRLCEPLPDGRRTLNGTLAGLNEDGHVVVETELGAVALPLATIEGARLVFELTSNPRPGAKRPGKKAQGATSPRPPSRGPQQSR